jgi:hypothetical protein
VHERHEYGAGCSRIQSGEDAGAGMPAEFNARNRLACASYLHRLTGAPFFSIALDDTQPVSRTTSDRNALIAQMAGLFEGIDLNSIRTSLIQLANILGQPPGRPAERGFILFAQRVLCANTAQDYTVTGRSEGIREFQGPGD